MSITSDPGTWTPGDRLRAARAGAGLTQDALAERLHVHRNSIRAYESNRQALNPWLVKAWAEICGADYEWLSGATPGGHGSTAATDGYLPVRALIAA